MPAKRKEDSNNDDAESVNSSSNGSVSARDSTKRPKVSTNKTAAIETIKNPSELSKELNDLIRNYRNEKGRLICEHLMRLPTKRTNLDYYELIKQPIDLIKIQQRLKTDEYLTFQQFDCDILLLISNAKQYHQKESTEYKDTIELEEYYLSEKKKRSIDTIQPEVEESVTDTEEAVDEADESITVTKKRGRANVKTSPAKANKLDTTTDDVSNQRTSRVKSINSDKEANLNIYLEDYFDIICSYQDETQRYLANVFYELPSAKDYPDYYETIKSPIGLKQIARKILNSSYNTLKQMELDLALMTDNAKRYNEPKSTIYKDACKLKRLTLETFKELNNLYNKGKMSQSSKSREKKHKLVEEIAANNGVEDPVTTSNIQIKVQEEHQQPQEENEEDEEDEEDDDDDDEELNESNEHKKATKRKNNHLMPTMWSLFDYMREYRQLNNTLIDPFVKLPSKRTYPDYYEDIKKPIALNVIKRKLNKRLYQSIRELSDDFELMFKNAMQYNVEESLIYKHAKRLLDALNQKVAELPLVITTLGTNSGAPSPAITTPSKKRLEIKRPQLDSKQLIAPLPKFSELKEKLIYLYNYINDFQIDNRELAPPFRVLPSKLEYPDYYTVIKKPIDMNKIWNRINQHNHSYTSLDEMCYDFAQMFENACIFNEPTSKIYKDALSLQQAVFTRRDEIVNSELNTAHSNCFSKDPVNDFQNEIDYIKKNDQLGSNFIQNATQCLFAYLFDSVLQYQDLETRTLSDSFINLYNKFDKLQVTNQDFILTFNSIKQRLNNKFYKRFDVFQHDMFQVFNQIRTIELESQKINEQSQLYRDSYDLQRYFISKRDEICRNGELLQTNAMSFKANVLDAQIAAVRGHYPQNFDETEHLLVEKRFRKLEQLVGVNTTNNEHKYQIGSFYFIDKSVVVSNLENEVQFNIENNSKQLICCVLASNSPQNKLVIQVYLQPSDQEFFDPELVKTNKFFEQEVFKTDLYSLIDVNNQELKQAFVVGVKEFVTTEPQYNDLITKQNLFICESIYSTEHKYIRKIVYKKWSATSFISNSTTGYQVPMLRRSIPLTINRYYQNEQIINDLIKRVDSKITEFSTQKQLFKEFTRQTVEYDSLPAALLAGANAKEKEADEFEPAAVVDEDPEIMKTAKHYEQLIYKDGELYKIGDYVYVKHQQNESKPPMIVRIDRLWSVNSDQTVNYYLRGALFLRPIEINHEPTRLFYKNEVFKEVTREITASLDQIVHSDHNTNKKKCVVLNAKKYVSCRLTEIDESDVYVCDSKYSLQLKTFRKFTKGLRKFELSVKCLEDECYFLRRELQLRKYMSPVLVNLTINYDEELPAIDVNTDFIENNDSNEEDWSDGGEGMLNDENSSHSFNINSQIMNENSNGVSSPSVFKTKDGSILKQKKIRVKRLKKSGYNLFSKDLRKRLRDTKSSLSFVNMSKEVGNKWRELSEKERAAYEEKAKMESIKEQQAAAAAAAALAQPTYNQLSSPQPQIYQTNQQPIYIQQTQNGFVAKQSPTILQSQQYQQQQPIYQQNGTQYIQQIQTVYEQAEQAPVTIPKQDHPKTVQHKEAYIKYIANMRKQQQLYSSNNISASITGIRPDWYNSIDIRTHRIKESKIAPPAATWVENCSHNDVVKHLLSLRYYLLNDAVNIERYNTDNDEITTTTTTTNEECLNNNQEEVFTELVNVTNNTEECMNIE